MANKRKRKEQPEEADLQQKKQEEEKVKKEFESFNQYVCNNPNSFFSKYQLGIEVNENLNINEEKLLMKATDDESISSRVLLYILYLGLPASSNTADYFVLQVLNSYDFPVASKFKTSLQEIDGVNAFTTPFKGIKNWIEKATLLKVETSDLDLLASVLQNRKETIIESDSTKKHRIEVSKIPGKIMEFRNRMLSSGQLSDEILWNYFILKCITGPRTEELFSLRKTDVIFNDKKDAVVIQYRKVKSKKDKIIHHTYQSNTSTGIKKDWFDIPKLFSRELEISAQLCPNDVNPLVFPFWITDGISVFKKPSTVNPWLAMRLPYSPHVTRDICVMLCQASNLSIEDTKLYLNHSPDSKTLGKHYSELSNQYKSFEIAPEERQKIFGCLTDNILLRPITQEITDVENYDIQIAHMTTKGFNIDVETVKLLEEDQYLLSYLYNSCRIERTLYVASLFKCTNLDEASDLPIVNFFEAVQIFKKENIMDITVLFILIPQAETIKTKSTLLKVKESLQVAQRMFTLE